MANEFIIKNGFRSQGNSEITGSFLQLGNSTLTGTLTMSTTNQINFYNSSYFIKAASGLELHTGGGDVINFWSGVSTLGTWSTTGLGIGTTSPSTRLQVRGSGATSATTALRVENTNTNASLVVLDNGYVGIGTGSAQYNLDLYGSYHQYQAQGELARYDISSANANQNRGIWSFYTNAATAPDFFGRFGFKFEGGTADSFKQFQIHVADSTTPKFVVDGSGRVGIGTITPAASLHISGASSAVLLQIDSPASSSILFVTGSGRVGIGTNSPAYPLEVSGSARVNGTLQTNYLSFRTADSFTAIYPTDDGFNQANNGSSLRFQSNTLAAARYGYNFRNATGTRSWTSGTGGDVVVAGTYSPTSGTGIFSTMVLETTVNQTGGANGITRGLLISPTLTAAADFRAIETTVGNVLLNTTSGNTSIGLPANTGTSRLQVRGSGATSATTALRVENTNASASLAVLDNGFVGIGKNTPISTLHLGNDTSGFLGDFTTPAITFSTLNNGIYLDSNRIFFKSGGGFSFSTDSNGLLGNGFRINSALFNDLTTPIFVPYRLTTLGLLAGLGGNDTGAVTLITSGSTRLYVSSSGNVGIGTSTPSTKLDVAGGDITVDTSRGMIFRSTSGYVKYNGSQLYNVSADSYDSSGYFRVRDNTGTNTRFIVLDGGNVGIGIPSPTARLQVRGSGTTSSTTALLVENSNASASLAVLDNSNVGIGTTTAAYRLSVLAPNAGDGIAAYVGVQAMIMTGNNGSGNPGISSNSGIIHVGSTINGTGGSEVLNVNKSNGGAYIQAWRSWSSTILSLVDGNGNFAIRRTSATASLDVAGTTRISGSFNTATSGSILTVIGSGSTQPILDIQGSQGQLFSVTDALSGSLMSVNDVSGLPILEVFSDDRIVMGTYGAPALTISGSAVTVATASAAPSGTVPEGTFRFATVGGAYFIYAFIGGAWRSGSLS